MCMSNLGISACESLLDFVWQKWILVCNFICLNYNKAIGVENLSCLLSGIYTYHCYEIVFFVLDIRLKLCVEIKFFTFFLKLSLK